METNDRTNIDLDEEVGSLLNNAGISRDEIENKDRTRGPNEATNLLDMITSGQLETIRGLAAISYIDTQIECRKLMQCEIDELSKRAADKFIQHLKNTAALAGAAAGTTNGFAPNLDSHEHLIEESNVAAVANSEVAGQAVASGLVPEFGAVLAKFEPGALAYGFPPAVEALIEKAKLDPVQTEELLRHFRELFQQIERWESDVESIHIAGVEDTASIAHAKELAKAIQKERLNAEKRKKIIKDPYLRPGQLIDGVFKVYVDQMNPIEKMAIAKAQYVENLERERKETIRLERVEQLKPFVENITAFNLHPDNMTDEAFTVTLDNCKAAHASREKEAAEAAEKAEKQARAKNRSYQLLELGFSRDDEAQRHIIGEITIYNNDLANEPDDVWGKRIAEITPRVTEIRSEQKRLADEAAAIKKAEEERIAAETDETLRKQREAETLALAPDKVKLEKLATDIEAIVFPEVANDKTIEILGGTKSDLYQVVTRLRAKLNQLP